MKKGLVIGMIMAFVLSGCGQAPQVEPSTPPPSASNGQQGGETTTPPEETKTTSTITAYYTDPNLMELREQEVSITYQDESEKYEQTFVRLTESPGEGFQPLWAEGQLNGIKLKEGTLSVDVSPTPEQNLGSTGEMFAIDALTQTFFQFDEVQSIQILVDGQVAETLMGHVEITEPFKRP
jgi:spore germination protein GerM